jgi:DNA-binding MarR family transcriptional regulator
MLLMNPEEADRGTAIPQALAHLRVVLNDAYTRASREVGLTPQQAELLCGALGPTTIGDLATELRCDRSNVTRLVDRVAGRGLARRREGDEDGRVTVVELTPAGRRLAERFIKGLEAQSASLRAAWTDERQDIAGQILTEIAGALDPGSPPARRRRATNRRLQYQKDA